MQSAEVVLGVLRERGRKGLPCNELYRQLFNPQLYLLAYGRIYSNQGAMTPGPTQETADDMSIEKIEAIIDAIRHERFLYGPRLSRPFLAEARWRAPARMNRLEGRWGLTGGRRRGGAQRFLGARRTRCRRRQQSCLGDPLLGARSRQCYKAVQRGRWRACSWQELTA
jgi:hypothetical protein